MRIPTLLAAAAIAAGGVAAGTAATRDDPPIPAATPDGPARSCIPLSQARESLVRSDRVIDFRTGGNRGWRVVLPQPCPELGFERRFGYATSLSELCSTDIITVLRDSPVARGASCGLAPFQPVVFARR